MNDKSRNVTDVKRLAQIYKLHLFGVREVDIAERYGITQQRVSQLIKKAKASLIPPDETIDELRAASSARLDATLADVAAILEEMRGILGEDHVKPAHDDEGDPTPDLWPKFLAADRINAAAKTVVAIEARRATLHGLDSPAKKEITADGGLRYEIVGVPIEEIIGEVSTE